MSQDDRARIYAGLVSRAHEAPSNRAERMKLVVDLVWDAMGSRPVESEQHPTGRPYSWVGFYTRERDADEMILTECRDTPACSPIGLHGMCGRSCVEQRSILVDDVRTLDTGYVACDPRDQSEIVLPLFDESGRCWGVLDGDSFDLAAFGDADLAGLADLVEAVGLTPPGSVDRDALRL